MSEFGKSELCYNTEHVLELIKEKKSEEIQAYISKYFIKLSTTKQVFMWIPEEKKFDILCDEVVSSRYFTRDMVIPFIFNDGKNKRS